MAALNDILAQKLQILAVKEQKRVILPSYRHNGVQVTRDGKNLISFSCNDYLGLASHPRVISAAEEALKKYGAGAGASRLVTGDCPLYSELENLIAEYNNTQGVCVFGSGYLANIGAIPALVGKNDLIIADKLAHACIIDGGKLSGATMLRFAHNNMAHLRILLESNRVEYQNCLIVTETVFSMDGDVAPLAELSAIAKEFDAWIMSDGAHSLNMDTKCDIKMGTLSKAAGSYGGYVCGSKTLVEYLKNAARSLIFSTALPPASLAASIEALKIMKKEPELCLKPLENARLFTQSLGLPEAKSAIVPLILGENDKALAAAALLAECGFLVTAIRPPTVPENTARLRFTFSALHTKEQIESLCAAILKLPAYVEMMSKS
jgi:8-amino-7-oxononanoate synthase